MIHYYYYYSGNFSVNHDQFHLLSLYLTHYFSFHFQHQALLVISLQTVHADSLYDVDESTYDVDESNALIPLVRTKHEALAHSGQANVELIDVRCDAKSGMIVTVEFEEVFSGIIYSQGYYSDPKCR